MHNDLLIHQHIGYKTYPILIKFIFLDSRIFIHEGYTLGVVLWLIEQVLAFKFLHRCLKHFLQT